VLPKTALAALTATLYKVVASKLPYGTQRFTLVAIDKAIRAGGGEGRGVSTMCRSRCRAARSPRS